MTETFAVIGALVTVAVAIIVLVVAAVALFCAIRNWLHAKNEIVKTTEALAETQARLMELNNDLNRRLSELEKEVRR